MEGYLLGSEALRQISQIVRDHVRGELHRRPQSHDAIQPIYIAKTGTGGIDALSGTTPGTADVTIHRVNPDGELEAATNQVGDEVTVEAYNLSSSAVAADTYIHLKQEIVSGKLLCDFEDCG